MSATDNDQDLEKQTREYLEDFFGIKTVEASPELGIKAHATLTKQNQHESY